MKRRIAYAALALSLVLAASAAAAEKTTICTMDFTLKGWSAGYSTARGSGTISCDNGQTAEVRLLRECGRCSRSR
jgi:opacity protein-like surface antigen